MPARRVTGEQDGAAARPVDKRGEVGEQWAEISVDGKGLALGAVAPRGRVEDNAVIPRAAADLPGEERAGVLAEPADRRRCEARCAGVRAGEVERLRRRVDVHDLGASRYEGERRGARMGEEREHAGGRGRDGGEPAPLLHLFEEHAALARRRRPYLERERDGRRPIERHVHEPGVGHRPGKSPGSGPSPAGLEHGRGRRPGVGEAAAGQAGQGQRAVHEHPAEQFQPPAATEIDERRVAKLSGGSGVHVR